jgi:glycosyltransferase involved in cell wall biosynthesis
VSPHEPLVVVFAGPRRSLNPDCTDLAAALGNHPGVGRLGYGVLSFWHGYRSTDVVHLHFPELLTDHREPGVADVTAVRERCRWWQDRGTAIVVTLHTWTPHGRATAAFAELYRAVFDHADLVVHFGPATAARAQALGWAPTARHETVPLHVMPTYGRPQDRGEARTAVGFDADEPVVVVAQTLRTTDEVDQVAAALDAGFRVVLAGAVQAFDDDTRQRVRRRRDELARDPRVHLHDGFVPDSVLARYVAVADVVLLARVDPCNSGVVPLGAALGRVVVGPDVGNVGCSLAELGFPRFDPGDPPTIAAALHDGLDLARAGAGDAAAEYALRHWAPEVVASRYVELYRTARIGRSRSDSPPTRPGTSAERSSASTPRRTLA